MKIPSPSTANKPLMATCRLWGSLWASLLFIAIVTTEAAAETPAQATIQRALDLQLYNQTPWLALLHLDHGKPRIKDSQFLLSATHFSPQQELIETLQLLLDSKTQTITQCRFPARQAWLAQQLNLAPANFSGCTALSEFLIKAPADHLSVVYASENLSSASSMMGHVLIKLSGLNAQQQPIEHAVSFFTEVKGLNLPKIMYDSIIAGKAGYFSLSPFREKLDYYAKKEQRNIWTYQIKLTDEQRLLIQLHLWELKQIPLQYFFHTYNCATFTNFILSVTGNATLYQAYGWKTPLDTIKLINAAGLVESTTFYPSSRARIRMLSADQSWGWHRHIQHAVYQHDLSLLPYSDQDIQSFRTLKTAQFYADYLNEKQHITPSAWQTISQDLLTQQQALPHNYHIDPSDYKNPTLTPKDSQWYSGLSHFNQKNYLRLGGFAAAHSIEDDNRQSMSENELRLGDLSILISPTDQTIRIDQFQLYHMASYVPFDVLTGGLSGRFAIGYGPQYDHQLQRHSAASVDGAIGLSAHLSSDVLIYGMADAGLRYGQHDAYATLSPEVGMFMNEVYGLKSIGSIKSTHQYWQTGRATPYYTAQWTQAIPVGIDHRVALKYTYQWNKQQHDQQAELLFKWFF
jgi:hypothetical protein